MFAVRLWPAAWVHRIRKTEIQKQANWKYGGSSTTDQILVIFGGNTQYQANLGLTIQCYENISYSHQAWWVLSCYQHHVSIVLLIPATSFSLYCVMDFLIYFSVAISIAYHVSGAHLLPRLPLPDAGKEPAMIWMTPRIVDSEVWPAIASGLCSVSTISFEAY